MKPRLDKSAVNDFITRRIAPLLAVDGGRIEVVAVNPATGEVDIRFTGTYRGNPCQAVVLRYVVEPLLKEGVPGVTAVAMVA